MDRKTFIVAINSISGGGKTTITKELQKQLSNARALYFDDRNYDSDNKSVLTDEMLRMIKACSKDSENRICTYLFKNVVELGVLSKMIGAALFEYTPQELKNVRQSVLDTVRKTHGIIFLEDAIEEEKKYRE